MEKANSNADSERQGQNQAMMVQLTTNTGVPKLHCPICNKALTSLNGYVKHMKKHEPPGGFSCRYCDARFCTDDDLKRHRDEMHTTIACRICQDVTFTNENDYREHIRTVHEGVDCKMLKCEKCGAEYKTMEPFKRHVESQCGKNKPHTCDQCGLSFVTKYNLKQHTDLHTGISKYCCSYCGKNFQQKGRLVEHERLHTGEKPYKCDVCGKCFAHRESIVTHSSIHTGIRLVECKCCQSRFSCYSNLIKHRRTRPNTCGLPQYDPPKNRGRTSRSRIPATLNPTSEIKVSSLNKVIKPGEKEQIKKEKTSRKRAVRTSTKTSTLRSRQKIAIASSVHAIKIKKEKEQDNEPVDEDLPLASSRPVNETGRNGEFNESEWECSDGSEFLTDDSRSRSDQHRITFRKTRNSQRPVEMKGEKSMRPMETGFPFSSDDDSPSFDPPDSDSADEENSCDETKYAKAVNTIKVEFSDLASGEVQCGAEQSGRNGGCEVKTENEGNIFQEKDKLLECLLKDSDPLVANGGDSFQIIKLEDGNILEETEIVLIKGQEGDALQAEEDALATNDVLECGPTDCKIVLEDIKSQYPLLKNKSSVNVGPVSEKKPVRRKYRKRGEPVNPPKRLAKLSQQELKDRLRMMRKDERSWQCPHCIKIYHVRKPFEKHLRDHNLPENEIKSILKTDEIGVVNEEIFKCHICDKIYLMEKRLLAHVKLHGPDGKLIFKCPCYCNIFFPTKAEATAHGHEKHRDLLYCEICDKFMTCIDGRKTHMKNHHHSEKTPRQHARNLVCDKCGKKFSGRTSLMDHVRSDCGRVPLYPCDICNKHFTTAGILKTHLLLHKDDTPYQCDKCGKSFKVKAQYKTHIKTRHTDYKPFQCHLCPKAYPYRESLLTHMTVHTGIKRFLCNGCGKRFTCISNLQAHRKVQADTCGLLPLNAKATQYMGVQKGNLLLGAKPEAGLDYTETNTLIAKEVIDRDQPMAQELNYPSEPSAPMATVPLNCSQTPASQLLFPQMMIPEFLNDAHLPLNNERH